MRHPDENEVSLPTSKNPSANCHDLHSSCIWQWKREASEGCSVLWFANYVSHLSCLFIFLYQWMTRPMMAADLCLPEHTFWLHTTEKRKEARLGGSGVKAWIYTKVQLLQPRSSHCQWQQQELLHLCANAWMQLTYSRRRVMSKHVEREEAMMVRKAKCVDQEKTASTVQSQEKWASKALPRTSTGTLKHSFIQVS